MSTVAFNTLFIGTGAAIMLVAIVTGLRLFRLLRQKNLRRIWLVQISLMVFFLAGYLLALRFVLAGNLSPIINLISVIFAFGAMFVYLTVHISLSLSRRLLTLNSELERKVTERTRELSDSHAELTRNIETLKKTQRQLLQSAKMASVGSLAAGVAHELNNPLAIIAGFSELLAAEGGKNADERFSKIRASVERMHSIISHLRVFSRDSSTDERKLIDIRNPISNAIAFTHLELGSANIEVRPEFRHNSSLIKGNSVQLESVFQNLLLNSRDAFSSLSGPVKKIVKIKSWTEENILHVSYDDNATGASPETLNHIFEPFYTTKEAGQGTGLGLAISHEIIDQHGGHIAARNIPGGGLEFRIDLPVTAHGTGQDLPVLRNGDSDHVAPNALKPRLLVVDDEVSMCNLIHAFLAEDFQVNTTSDPELALDLISNQKFDMIVTDLRMPHVSGIEIIRKAKEQQPKTPVIAITGFPKESPLVTKAVESGANAVLNKPFVGKDNFRSKLMGELHHAPS